MKKLVIGLVCVLFVIALVSPTIAESANPKYEAKGLELVATALDSSSESPLIHVWVHGDYVYVGGHNPGYYTSPPVDIGVRILDISDPEKPVLVARIPLGEGGWRGPNPAEPHLCGDAVVTHLETDVFVGDVAVVLNGVPTGTSVSSTGNPIGIWDVTDPKNPQFLSHVEFGWMAHNDYYVRQMSIGGTLLFALFGTEEEMAGKHGLVDGRISRIGIADLSDPRNPVIKATWNDDETYPYITNVRANTAGTRVYISGVAPALTYNASPEIGLLYILDIADPAEPTEIGRYTYDLVGVPSEPLAVPHGQKDLVIVSDGSWMAGRYGHLHIINISDLSNIREISTFKIPESDQPTSSGYWPLCLQLEVQGDMVYSTWVSGGMYVVDISDPSQPVEVAHFVLTGYDQHMLGVYPKGDLILAAQIWEAGLYILRLTPEK